MEQDPKQKDTNTQKDTAKGHAGLLPMLLLLLLSPLSLSLLLLLVSAAAVGKI